MQTLYEISSIVKEKTFLKFGNINVF